MSKQFSINSAALADVLGQAQDAVAQGVSVEDLDFLTSSWNPNDFPDSLQVGALLRAVHQIELIDGPEGMVIRYLEEDLDGSGSYAFFVENEQEYDEVRVLSDFGQVGHMVEFGLRGVEAAVAVVEQAIQMANEALARLQLHHSQNTPLASHFSARQVELMLQAVVQLYREAPEQAEYLAVEQIDLLQILDAAAERPEVSFEVTYTLTIEERQLAAQVVPIMASDEEQAAERARKWIAQNDLRYADHSLITIEEIEET